MYPRSFSLSIQLDGSWREWVVSTTLRQIWRVYTPTLGDADVVLRSAIFAITIQLYSRYRKIVLPWIFYDHIDRFYKALNTMVREGTWGEPHLLALFLVMAVVRSVDGSQGIDKQNFPLFLRLFLHTMQELQLQCVDKENFHLYPLAKTWFYLLTFLQRASFVDGEDNGSTSPERFAPYQLLENLPGPKSHVSICYGSVVLPSILSTMNTAWDVRMIIEALKMRFITLYSPIAAANQQDQTNALIRRNNQMLLYLDEIRDQQRPRHDLLVQVILGH